ncbi:hypothetical protein [Actinoallomurus rhizosphaericola]|uniref:hypothetical protein n=1 Tax=Actinoallomurus rhizosphaericola TaxID=2952536 RepID=UPI003872C1E3
MTTPGGNGPRPPICGKRTATNKLAEDLWWKIDETCPVCVSACPIVPAWLPLFPCSSGVLVSAGDGGIDAEGPLDVADGVVFDLHLL